MSHRLLRLLSLLTLGLWLLAAGMAGAMAAAPGEQVLDAGEFAASPEGPWTPVSLPDSWSQRGLHGPGRGFYRLSFQLDAQPEGLWALRVARLSTHHAIRVNGHLVSGTLPVEGVVQRRPTPVLATLPPALLRAGENRLEIEVDNGVRAGLSPIELGLAAVVEQEFLSGYHLNVTLPQMLNVGSGGVCLLTLFLWWRRRSEVALGSFGVLGLLTSARNFSYYRVGTDWPAAIGDFFYFAAQVASVVLLGFFAMALSGRRPRGFRPALVAGGATMMLLGAAAAAQGLTHQARALTYPLLLLLTLPSLWLVGRRARELRTGALMALLCGLVVVLGAGVHDYFYQQGHTSVMDAYWLPYAVPVALVAFAGVLVRRIVGALHQVEELNQTLEQRVRERTHELQVANQAKTRFLAAASHDLRQPVVTIGLLIGLLREKIADPALRTMAMRVDEAVASMEGLLAGLLDLSRLDSGTLKPRLQTVALQPLFDAIAAHEAEAAQRKGLSLRIRATDLAVRSDPVLLEQILRNFVSNALRYTERGGVLLAARRSSAGKVRLQVWDTGRGIAIEQQPAVFEEFVQLDNPQRDRRQGLGLGLAIVRRSAALLGAPLALASRPGRGSCFELRVPLAARDDAPPVEAESPEPLLVGATVVLVEDDEAVREALRARLAAWGARVLVFDGPHALRVALDAQSPDSRRADLIVTDQRLPGGSGLDVIQLARRRYGALPALVVTGDTAPQDIARLAASGARVLHKPFRAEELHAAIVALLRG